MNTDRYLKFAILFSITAVIIGAIGTHTLKNIITTKQLISFETGIRYQMIHGIAILILALNNKKFNYKLKSSLNLMTIGVFCFSLPIYLLNLQELLGSWLSLLAVITPIGGVLLIAGWFNLFLAIKKTN